jgi:predicted GNAT family acetyltransferase
MYLIIMKSRKLLPSDLDSVRELVEARWATIRRRRDSDHDHELYSRISKFVTATASQVEGSGQAFGAYDHNGVLISIITQRFWKSMPIHYISNMTVRPGISNLYDVAAMGLSACIDKAVEFAEQNEFFSWYWTTEVRGWDHRESQWYDNSSSFRRYHIFIDSVYKKGQQPRFEYQKLMLGEHGATANMAIKFAVLKPEILHNYYKKTGVIKADFEPRQYQAIPEHELRVPLSAYDIQIEQCDLEFAMSLRDQLTEGNILIDPHEYPEYIAQGQHVYFKAMINNEFAGISAMTKHASEDGTKIRVYHRMAYVDPKFRQQGVWLALMKHKIKYINANQWCDDSTWHSVSVAESDFRYKNHGWTLHAQNHQLVIDAQGHEQYIPRCLYICKWSDLQNLYNV